MEFIVLEEGQDIFELLRENDKLVKEDAKKYEKWIALFVPGTKYVKITDDGLIYGVVLDPLEDTSEEEKEYLKEVYEGSPEMRFVRAFSVYMPRGEMGDEWPQTVHFIISEADFELAKTLEWPKDKIQSLDESTIKVITDHMG